MVKEDELGRGMDARGIASLMERFWRISLGIMAHLCFTTKLVLLHRCLDIDDI